MTFRERLKSHYECLQAITTFISNSVSDRKDNLYQHDAIAKGDTGSADAVSECVVVVFS